MQKFVEQGMRTILSVSVMLCIAVLCLGPSFARADNAYTPAGLYNVEEVKLGNGFRVLLKRRSQAHSVAVRLAVHVGTRHFDCRRSEAPHVLEHLLFSGTAKHSESELEPVDRRPRRLMERGHWTGVHHV